MAAQVMGVSMPEADDQAETSRAIERADRRRTRFIQKIAATNTPREKLEASLDYYRAVIADQRVNQVKAGTATDHLAERLIASADQLANTIRRTR